MNGYTGYDPDGMNQTNDGSNGNLRQMSQDGLAGNNGYGGQSLDEIVNQNANVMRRLSIPSQQQYGASQQQAVDANLRRVSMMEFGGQVSPGGSLGNFQFNTGAQMDEAGMMGGNGTSASMRHQGSHSASNSRRQSHTDQLAINTNFANASAGFNGMAYSSPMHTQSGFDMAMQSPYIDNALGMQIDFGVDQSMNSGAGIDMSQMNMFAQPQFHQNIMASPMQHSGSQGTPLSAQGPTQESGIAGGMSTSHSGHSGSTDTMQRMLKTQSTQVSDSLSSPQHSGGVTPMNQSTSGSVQPNHANSGFQAQPQYPEAGSAQDRGMHGASQQYDGINGPLPVNVASYNPNNQGFKWEAQEGGWPSTMVKRPHMQTSYKNAYSSTGFDMLSVLVRVATRPQPEINIGTVDLSCAFVVCDAEKDDFPIVYCSDNFERLTGYTKHMILGRNCRFLQSPDGNVEPGVRRKYVDDDSVLYMKNMINLRREAQISLINYRRGGQPFMNLLTMIPISWDSDQVKFFVGFQVDLVEQPNAVTNKNADGSYSINYQRGMTMPRYIVNAPEQSSKTDLGQTVPRDDVSTILATIGNGESEYAKRMWDKVLLENTDDVVHVLSLKGLFQWVSPSAARVLEYEPSELIGTALSSVCHPSDIVPVTRELKDTSTGAAVNVVFRIRRKDSGYMWFEGHGSLHTEQGKGRKSIILVGRERPVYALSKQEIDAGGGIGESELWTKLSTSGMFLFVSSNVRQLLDRQPDEMIGLSLQSLMRAESKAEFGRVLEHARTGKRATVKHEMINRRGQVLSAITTLYPGDAIEGQKPTFIVAQTRLIKFSRGPSGARPNIYGKHERASSESLQSGTTPGLAAGSHTPASMKPDTRFPATDGSAATYAGQNGLLLGHQDHTLASEDNLFDELKTTKSSSWQYEIRQLEKRNRLLAEEVQSLIASKKKRKRRRGKDQQKDCANCHTRVTPEWRRGPSGARDLCNSCGLRWAKVNGRVSPRTSSVHSASPSEGKGSKASASPSYHPQQAPSQTHPHATIIKTESPSESQLQTQGYVQPFGQRPSPTAAMGGFDSEGRSSLSHSPFSAKGPFGVEGGHAASMEGASGVPGRIEEGIEPD